MNLSVQTMDASALLTLLTLIVALSAYLATIRLLLIERLSETNDSIKKREIKNRLAALTLADAPMILAGLFLGLHVFYSDVFTNQVTPWMLRWSIRFFVVGGVFLVLFHAKAWIKSVYEYITG